MRHQLAVQTLLGLFLLITAAACGGPPAPESEAGLTTGAASQTLHQRSPCEGTLPAAIVTPAGQELDFHLHAAGVQIYQCQATATGTAWVFTAPEATLYDGAGTVAGKHYLSTGPTWQANDGSVVVGARLAGASVDPASIPWLLLRAAAHTGDGRMGEVTFVQRVATNGGLAPAGACTAGDVARVPYTADYCFSEAD